MRSLVALALFALLLGIPSVALALRLESFGNEPQAAVAGPQGLLEVVHLRSRVYFLGGDDLNICYFRGNAKDLQTRNCQRLACACRCDRRVLPNVNRLCCRSPASRSNWLLFSRCVGTRPLSNRSAVTPPPR